VRAFDGARPLLMVAGTTAGTPATQPEHTWYRAYGLSRERERGLDWQDDHLHAMTTHATLRAGETLTLVVSADTAAPPVVKAWQRRRDHEASVLERWRAGSAAPAWIDHLALAADQFVVCRLHADDPDGMTVIAGYPWFGDWGRDTMIALPGLALTTGRIEIAKNILLAFAEHVDRGMLPNLFPDASETPEYNTVDATLWFFEAIRALKVKTGDSRFVREHFCGVLRDIIDWHVRGTRYGIRMDDDGLLNAGEPGVQLTWMDAKVGDWVVTPRYGKPVEIQALWYNALRIMQELAEEFGDPQRAKEYALMASRATQSFNELFWNEVDGCLYDVVQGEDRDSSIRPNQILAVSLPFPILAHDKARGMVEVVERELLTPVGLRSLSPRDPQYRPTYEGGPLSRDGAYHQGTVWPWLLGPFITAYLRVHAHWPEARERAAGWLRGFASHLEDAGLGQISEIFDAEPPHRPRGCVAQAWSVAELLRVAVEEVFEPALGQEMAATRSGG
jgi:predicted glycogen debranching enzyme